MLSKIDICNMALAQLGQEPISSLKQEDERARRCHLFYEPVKREVMRTHNWAFAGSIAPLALLETGGDAPWPFTYAYPLDCLFLRRVFGKGQPRDAAFKEVYRQDLGVRTVLTGAETAMAEYTRDVKDEAQLDPAFVKAFSLALAADLAVTLTGDMGLSQRLLQKYTLALDEARRSNMTENYDVRRSVSAFEEAR